MLARALVQSGMDCVLAVGESPTLARSHTTVTRTHTHTTVTHSHTQSRARACVRVHVRSHTHSTQSHAHTHARTHLVPSGMDSVYAVGDCRPSVCFAL